MAASAISLMAVDPDVSVVSIEIRESSPRPSALRSQERLSERIGKNRATVANFLRLLRLPAEVQLGLRD